MHCRSDSIHHDLRDGVGVLIRVEEMLHLKLWRPVGRLPTQVVPKRQRFQCSGLGLLLLFSHAHIIAGAQATLFRVTLYARERVFGIGRASCRERGWIWGGVERSR